MFYWYPWLVPTEDDTLLIVLVNKVFISLKNRVKCRTTPLRCSKAQWRREPPSRINCTYFESLVLSSPSEVIGEDTDILVLLSLFVDQKGYDLIFTSDKVGKVTRRCNMKRFAGPYREARHDLFLHALTGCNSTSRPFKIRRPIAIRKLL